MAVRAQTYAPARPVPYLLEQGYSNAAGTTGQRITCPIRSTGAGSTVAVTESGSTVTVTDPSGTNLVAAAAITGIDAAGVPYYDFAAGVPATTEALGAGWDVSWSLVIGGEVYPYRLSAIVCEWVPFNLITAADLYGIIPELRHQVPPAQRDTTEGGDGTGWAPQIDSAYYSLIRKLMSDSRPIWYMREPEGYREWLLAEAVRRAVNTVPARDDGGVWATYRKDAYHEAQRANAGLKLQFTTDGADTRRAGELSLVMSPTGRPLL